MDSKQNSNDQAVSRNFNVAHSAFEMKASFARPKIAIGDIFILENDRIEPSEKEKSQRFGHTSDELESSPEAALAPLKQKFLEDQTERLNDALSRSVITYENYLSDARAHASIEVRDIAAASLEAELMLIQDPSMKRDMVAKIKDGKSAEVALDETYQEKIDMFLGMELDQFKKFAVEMEQHRATIQHHLHPDKTLATMDSVKEGTILVSKMFPLHALSSFRDRKVGKRLVEGAVTDEGSMESHGAILITSMGVVYARISQDDMARMKNGDKAVLDGVHEVVLLQPNKDTLEVYERLVNAQNEQRQALLEKHKKSKSVKTQDGVKVNVLANFATSDELYDLREANTSGIGLYRTEIAAAMRENRVTVENWRHIIKHNMEGADPKEEGIIKATIRTIDLAGDKSNLPKAERARIQEEMTTTQMRAFALVQDEFADLGYKSKLKIMVPMIDSVETMRHMQDMMDREAAEVQAPTIKLGCMIEVVAVLDELEKLDTAFMSVGSNDLIHSILGINRYDSESIKKYDPTNPSVLKALDKVATVGGESDIPVSICGNMASDPKYTALLIGAGLQDLSAGIDSIPAVKEMATRVDTQEARHLFEVLCETETREEREAILTGFNGRLGMDQQGRMNMHWKPPESEWVPDGNMYG